MYITDRHFVDLTGSPFGSRNDPEYAIRKRQFCGDCHRNKTPLPHEFSRSAVPDQRFRRIESLYYDYIRSQSTEIQTMLNRIAAMPEISKQPADE
jgi:hypothetical protein